MTIPLVVDTDCGIDDALALLFLLASPEIELTAITTVYGTGPVDQVVSNVLAVLGLDGRADIPVYRGSARPLLRDVRYSPHVHGDNGLGNIDRPPAVAEVQPGSAIDFYVDELASSSRKVTVLTLGGLTNLALALAVRPSLATTIERMVVMGGAFWVPGNLTPTAESNIVKDPEAAAMVLGAGVPITFIGLDVCSRVFVPDDLRQTLASGNRRAQFAEEITRRYVEFHRVSGQNGMILPDPTAAACVLRPDLFSLSEQYVEIDTAGPLSAGKTFAHPSHAIGRGLRATVALDVDADQVRSLILRGVMAEPARPT